MRPLLTFFLLTGLLPALCAQQPGADSAYFVYLKNGNRLYTSRLHLKTSSAAEQSLQLANGQDIPMDQVDRFRSRAGTFVAVPGSAGTDLYHVDQEGSRISLYSRVFIDPRRFGDSGYLPLREYYFRKEGKTTMHPVTYASLMNAMSDRPDAQRQLSLTKTDAVIGFSTLFAGFVVEAVGIGLSLHRPTVATQVQPPYGPPLTEYSFGSRQLSPLVFVGAGGLIAGAVFLATAHHHQRKAIDLYNNLP